VDFLKQMRLKISAQLILEEGSNIAEVAYSCGFNDEKYFRKCFKEFFGMTPTAFRKENI
jgi:AraC-like DNA-binding protein